MMRMLGTRYPLESAIEAEVKKRADDFPNETADERGNALISDVALVKVCGRLAADML